jgi:hypothetical protein
MSLRIRNQSGKGLKPATERSKAVHKSRNTAILVVPAGVFDRPGNSLVFEGRTLNLLPLRSKIIDSPGKSEEYPAKWDLAGG